jgi:hypothetical protein
MFRRLADRFTNATFGSSLDEKVRTLQALGFEESEARTALQNANEDVDRAAELLFASGSTNHTTGAALSNNQDEALRNAIQESMQSEEQRRCKQAQEASLQPQRHTRSAAGNHAALAAAKRAEDCKRFGSNHIPASKTRSYSGGLSTHHPDVKVPAKLEHKSKEEQILRCADRLKSYPTAVDTLYKALTMIRNNPGVDKYRRIDKTTAGYKRSLENVPGAEQLLKTMNFAARGPSTLVMDRSQVDSALLYLGISALESAKRSPEYQEEKRKIAFAKEFQEIHGASDTSAQEAIKRAEYLSKCPSEPQNNGALMQVVIGSDTTIKRRFDGDDVLQDVLNWMGAHGSQIPDKLLSREWCLVDLNRYPIVPIDCERYQNKTLQFIGFWPSGRLEIRHSPREWFEERKTESQMGSSRGLGSAPSDALH